MAQPYVAGDQQETTYFSNGANGSTVGYPVMLPLEWVDLGGQMSTYTVAHGEEAEVSVSGVYRLGLSVFIREAHSASATIPIAVKFIVRVWSTSTGSQKTVRLIGGWMGFHGTANATAVCSADLLLDDGDRVSIYAQVANGAVRLSKAAWGADTEGTTASLVKVG